MDPREWLFDKRVVRRNLDKGVLNIKAFNDYLKTLDNLESEFEYIEVDPRDKADAGDEADD